MPRFHFNIVDGVNIPDVVGMDCTEVQAKEVARNIARQIAIEVGTHHQRKVVVVGEDGSQVHEVPVKS
jgi:hypothetical protein